MSSRPGAITFAASLADIQAAISFRGNGDGGRVVIDVPRSDAGALLLLQQYGANMLLDVTVKFIKPKEKPADLDADDESIESVLASLDED